MRSPNGLRDFPRWKTVTSWPRRSNASTAWRPMKPVPPTTRVRNGFRTYRVTYQRSARHGAASAGRCAIGSGELSTQERMAGDGYAGVIAKEPFAKPFLESLAKG